MRVVEESEVMSVTDGVDNARIVCRERNPEK